jgi:hypothetical protein
MKKIFLLFLLTAPTFFYSCKKSSTSNQDGSGGNTAGKVYAVGYENPGDAFSRPRTAALWIDGVRKSLTDGTKDAKANAIFLTSSDVYAVGHESNGTKNVAKIWKNDVGTSLTDGSKNAVATDVFVNGTDVYVVGYEAYGILSGEELTKPVLWKNGVANYLPIDGNNGLTLATSIAVSGNDVYVAGTERLIVNGFYSFTAKLWKNGVATVVSSANQITFCKAVVAVSGNDVYTGCLEQLINGNINFTTKKNGVAIGTLTGLVLSSAWGFTVTGSDVYLAAKKANGYNAVYKNGVEVSSISLSSSLVNLNSIVVSGNDIYVSGPGGSTTNFLRAIYTKNGVVTDLSTAVKSSEVLDIAVKN